MNMIPVEDNTNGLNLCGNNINKVLTNHCNTSNRNIYSLPILFFKTKIKILLFLNSEKCHINSVSRKLWGRKNRLEFAPFLATLALKFTLMYGKGQTHALLLMTTCNLGSVCVGVVWNSWNGMCHLVPPGSEYRAHMSDHWLGYRTLVQNMHIFRLFLDGYKWF